VKKKKTSSKRLQEKRKNTRETTFFIINLILTILIGIYSTVIVVKQDQKFQHEFVSYQEEMSIKYSYTDLSISVSYGTQFYWTCFPFISVHNNGKINAENVKIYIELENINESWEDYINSVDQFKITSLGYTDYQTKTSEIEYYSTLFDDRENLIEISIDYILPETSKTFYIVPVFDQLNIENEISNDVDIIHEDSYEEFGKYIHEFFSIANFSITTECENCIFSEKSSEEFIDTSNLFGCHYQVYDREELENNTEYISGSLTYIVMLPGEGTSLVKTLPEIIDLTQQQ